MKLQNSHILTILKIGFNDANWEKNKKTRPKAEMEKKERSVTINDDPKRDLPLLKAKPFFRFYPKTAYTFLQPAAEEEYAAHASVS